MASLAHVSAAPGAVPAAAPATPATPGTPGAAIDVSAAPGTASAAPGTASAAPGAASAAPGAEGAAPAAPVAPDAASAPSTGVEPSGQPPGPTPRDCAGARRPTGPSGIHVLKLEAFRAGRFSAVELEVLEALGATAQYLVIEEGGAEFTVHGDALETTVRHLREQGPAPNGIPHTVDAIYVPEHTAVHATTAGDRAACRLAGLEAVHVAAPLAGTRWAPVTRALAASRADRGAPERGERMRVHRPDGLQLPAIAAEPEYPAESWPFLIALGRLAGVLYAKVTPSGSVDARLVRGDALTEAFQSHPEWFGAPAR